MNIKTVWYKDWSIQRQPALATLQLPTRFIVVHHSDTPQPKTEAEARALVRRIQQFHVKQRGWKDIGYNWLIGPDGVIWEGRGWNQTGAHAPDYNHRSHGICFLGTNPHLSPDAIETFRWLVWAGQHYGKVARDVEIIGHRQVRKTACPGDNIMAQLPELAKPWDGNG
jgi:N-acetylmuramoyl-L-alanine amidase